MDKELEKFIEELWDATFETGPIALKSDFIDAMKKMYDRGFSDCKKEVK